MVTLNVYAAGLVALYAAGLYHAVQAAEAAGTLTLACDGMKTTQPSVPDWTPGLSLAHRRTGDRIAVRGNVFDPQGDDIAAA